MKVRVPGITAFLILFLSGCALLFPAAPSPELQPPATESPAPVTGSPTPASGAVAAAAPFPSPTPVPPDTGWQPALPGLERRVIRLTEGEQLLERVTLLRLDPTSYDFSVAYRPGDSQSLTDWQLETGALLVVNGGFFTPENLATGLTIVNGERFGISYAGFGGMFVVRADGPAIYSLAEQPVDSAGEIVYGLQSFPLLIQPGGQPTAIEEDGQRARRTAVAIDRNGRVLFAFAGIGQFSLAQWQQFLLEADLNLAVALNLDGGGSTGYLLRDGGGEFAFSPLPTVITVFPR